MIKLNNIYSYLITNSSVKWIRACFVVLDIILMALWLMFGYDFMQYVVYSVLAELTLLAVISYLQTLKEIDYNIKHDAVRSVGKLFFEKRYR
jgi:hypothetical protein